MEGGSQEEQQQEPYSYDSGSGDDVFEFEEPKFGEFSIFTSLSVMGSPPEITKNTYSYSICGRHGYVFYGTYRNHLYPSVEWDDVSFIPVDDPGKATELYDYLMDEHTTHYSTRITPLNFIRRCKILEKSLIVIDRVTPLKIWLSEKKRSLADRLGRAPTAADGKHWWSLIEPEFRILFRNVFAGLMSLYEKGLVLGDVSSGIVICKWSGFTKSFSMCSPEIRSGLIPRPSSGKTAGEEIEELRSVLVSVVCYPFGGRAVEDKWWLPLEVGDVLKRLDYKNNPLLAEVAVPPKVVLAAASFFWNEQQRFFFTRDYLHLLYREIPRDVFNADFDFVYGVSWVDLIPPAGLFRVLFARFVKEEPEQFSIVDFMSFVYFEFVGVSYELGLGRNREKYLDSDDIELGLCTTFPGLYHALIDVLLRAKLSQGVVEDMFRRILIS